MVLDGMRIRAILTPVDGESLHKNPTAGMLPPDDEPSAHAMRAAEEEKTRKKEKDKPATPVVRLVWIGGSVAAMQLVNVYMHVSAILSAP